MTNISFINQKPVHIFGGAIGTELQARGYQTKLPLWSAPANLEAPELLKAIYKDYIQAGSDITITNTFRTTEWTLKKAKQDPNLARKQVVAAVDILEQAQRETRQKILIGGCVAPLEDCYDIESVQSDQTLYQEHEKLVSHLAATGKVDFIIAETQVRIREAEIIAELARKYELPFWVSFVTDGINTLSGELLQKAAKAFSKKNTEALLLNCRSPQELTLGLEVLQRHCEIPYGAYGNGVGHAHNDLGWKFDSSFDEALAAYLEEVALWIKLGSRFVGGCCGTNPDYHRAIRDQLL